MAALCLALGAGSYANTRPQSPNPKAIQKEKVMTIHASGTFEVKLTPQDDQAIGSPFGRMLLDKQFHGDLEGTSKGQMLAAGTGAKNSSGGYVALELVTGKLHGRQGSFVLQHSGTMNRGAQQLSVTVVPDSGTDELTGLSGKLDIKIADGKHFYEFDYALAKMP